MFKDIGLDAIEKHCHGCSIQENIWQLQRPELHVGDLRNLSGAARIST